MVAPKKVDIADDALPIISAMRWEQRSGGWAGILTSGQLERDLYLAVNKGLTALGGKWNRREGAHIFRLDPRQDIAALLDNGYAEVERDGFFETPEHVGRQMAIMANIQPGASVLEPSAGLGALVRAIEMEAPGCQIYVIEKNRNRAAKLEGDGWALIAYDFLEYADDPDAIRYDRVIQNPPFEELQDIDHVYAAYKVLKPGGILVSVMCESPFFRETDKARDFRDWLDEVDGETVTLPPDTFNGINTRLVRIEKQPQPYAPDLAGLPLFDAAERGR